MYGVRWCKEQTRGIRLADPNDNLSREYLKNAEESMLVLRSIEKTNSKMWLATVKYYVEYFAVYSVLMKLGIKSEIHDCTIALTRFLEKEGILPKRLSKALRRDKGLRIENQYYLKNRQVKIDFEELSGFLVAIKRALYVLEKEKIETIRDKIGEA